MSGKILLVDDIASNRIVLRVKLSSAFYSVSQASTVDEALVSAQSEPPDMVILSAHLPENGARRLISALRATPGMSDLPVLAIAPPMTEAARIALLELGVDDVLEKPLDNLHLHARLRNLMRARAELPRVMGLAEPMAIYERPARILIAGHDRAKVVGLRPALAEQTPHRIAFADFDTLPAVISGGEAPEAVVLVVDPNHSGAAFRMLSELRSHARTQHAATLVVFTKPAKNTTCAHALDLGAWAVMHSGGPLSELSVRLSALITKKRQNDRLRASVQNGLRAAITDPLTGLHNRRYALPKLEKMLIESRAKNRPLAVMLADLDHFKRINDSFGHAAGDEILIETCRRLAESIGPQDLLARIGGEEFLIALPDCPRTTARLRARALCDRIREAPFGLAGKNTRVPVTISIGVALYGDEPCTTESVADILAKADRALYGAKAQGRDKVTFGRPSLNGRLTA